MTILRQYPYTLLQKITDLFGKDGRNVFYEIRERINERALDIAAGVADNFVSIDADGNMQDSGKDSPSGDVVGTTDVQTLTNKTLEDVKVDGMTLTDTVWDDFVVPSQSIRLSGANPADEVVYKDGIAVSFDDGVDEYVYFTVQLPHKYKEGTDVNFHIHWTVKTSGAGGGAENVKWDLTYSASSPVDTAESWPASSPGTATVDVQNDSADDHLVDTIATLDGTDFKISEVIICSLKRDTAVANNYTDEVYIVSMDVHYEIDTMGSDEEFVK